MHFLNKQNADHLQLNMEQNAETWPKGHQDADIIGSALTYWALIELLLALYYLGIRLLFNFATLGEGAQAGHPGGSGGPPPSAWSSQFFFKGDTKGNGLEKGFVWIM